MKVNAVRLVSQEKLPPQVELCVPVTINRPGGKVSVKLTAAVVEDGLTTVNLSKEVPLNAVEVGIKALVILG